MRFLDSNVLIRYLTADDPAKATATFELLQRIKRGEEEVFITDAHIHEVTYVLASRSLYALSHAEVRDRLTPILSLPGLKLANRRRCLAALDLFAEHPFLDFADALAVICARQQRMDGIYSYDEDFDRLSGSVRVEP